MPDATGRFVDACRAANARAASLDFPPFTTGLRTETPLNSAPYIFDLPSFRQTFGSSTRRLAIIESFVQALDHLAACGAAWRMVLVGGSFIRPGPDPSDLDGLVVYDIDPARAGAAGCALQGFAAMTRSWPIDLRLCPADAGPLILVKRSIFFSNLFSYDRQCDRLVRGTLILIPVAAATPSGAESWGRP